MKWKRLQLLRRDILLADHPCMFQLTALQKAGFPMKWKFKPTLRDVRNGDVEFGEELLISNDDPYYCYYKWRLTKLKPKRNSTISK